MDLKLTGLRALITGASKGLGYKTAELLAVEGALIGINSRNSEHITKAARMITEKTGIQVLAIPADISDPDSSEMLVQEIYNSLGGLDILITNADGPPPGQFEAISDDQWQKALEVSLLSHMKLIRAALPHLKRSTYPAVLAITSYAAKQPIEGLVLSNTIRAGMLGLINTLSLELAQDKIRFNAILPGWTRTERIETLMNARAQAHGTTPEEEYDKQTAEIPMGRMALPEEFARVATFLVSPAASYINGVMLPVDGGITRGLL